MKWIGYFKPLQGINGATAPMPMIKFQIRDNDGKGHDAECLIDTGSSLSMVDTQFRKKLNLATIGIVPINMTNNLEDRETFNCEIISKTSTIKLVCADAPLISQGHICDILLGMDFLTQFVLQVDGTKGVVELSV